MPLATFCIDVHAKPCLRTSRAGWRRRWWTGTIRRHAPFVLGDGVKTTAALLGKCCHAYEKSGRDGERRATVARLNNRAAEGRNRLVISGMLRSIGALLIALPVALGERGAAAQEATPAAPLIASLAAACDGSLPGGRMVYLTGGRGEDGAIVIAEADGTELGRFPIQGAGIIRPTAYPGRALVQDFGGEGGSTFYLVYAEKVDVSPIDIPGDGEGAMSVSSPWVSQSRGSR